MEHLITIHATDNNRIVAQSLFFPDVRAEGATEEEAIALVRKELTERLARTRLVRIEVPEASPRNPWLEACGTFADDPQYEAYHEELRKARAADVVP